MYGAYCGTPQLEVTSIVMHLQHDDLLAYPRVSLVGSLLEQPALDSPDSGVRKWLLSIFVNNGQLVCAYKALFSAGYTTYLRCCCLVEPIWL